MKGQAVSHITKEDLKRIREHLKKEKNIVLAAYIDIGLNAALTFSELASLRLEDLNSNPIIKGNRKIYFNQTCKDSIKKLKKYYQDLGFKTDEGYLFKSLSPKNKKYKIDATFTNGAMSKIFRNLKDTLSITYPIGTGSLKKTWYHIIFNSYTEEDIEKVYDRNVIY